MARSMAASVSNSRGRPRGIRSGVCRVIFVYLDQSVVKSKLASHRALTHRRHKIPMRLSDYAEARNSQMRDDELNFAAQAQCDDGRRNLRSNSGLRLEPRRQPGEASKAGCAPPQPRLS